MDRTEARWLVCGECGDQTAVCRRCDRGQRYCTKRCRQDARRDTTRRARAKHRRSEEGRLDHRDAERRRRAVRRIARVADPRSKNLPEQAQAPSAQAEVRSDARDPAQAHGWQNTDGNSGAFMGAHLVLAPSVARRACAVANTVADAAGLHCLACGRPVVLARVLVRSSCRSSRAPPFDPFQ